MFVSVRLTQRHSLIFSRVPLTECFQGDWETDSRVRIGLIFYEETISTVENSPETATWFFKSQLEQERPRNLAQSPPDRTEAVDTGVTTGMAADSPQRLRFGRGARIKQGRDFARVRSEGERVVLGCLIANWRLLPGDSQSRLGVVTSGKIGNAVVRNRARRVLREVFRLHQHELAKPVDLVLIARASIRGRAYAEVEKDFLTTLRKARLLG